MKIARESAVKHDYTFLNKTDLITGFQEQKGILNVEFQDIEDQNVEFLMTKPLTCSSKDIRETIQIHLIPLYMILRDLLETSVYETRV